MQTSSKSHAVIEQVPDDKEILAPEWNDRQAREWVLARLRLLWTARKFLLRCALIGFLAATLTALLIPKEYISTARLMPPDSPPGGELAAMAALAGQNTAGLGAIAGDLLGVKTSGALFISVMRSRTVEDRIIQRFDLRKVYGARLQESARKRLETNTGISEERKSGIITLSVRDHVPKLAQTIAGAYIEELDNLMAQLNTSSAHRERVFLGERLDTIKLDLQSAERDFSQFASKNGAIDITAQGKAMLEGAATLEGQLIAAQSELEGLRQVYSDNNVRVRATQARIAELRLQQEKLGGRYIQNGSSGTEPSDGNSYPTLRQLPILGVPYADKFRQLKVDEAVYETLTKQYELAKVQEAKEIPSVQVLDAPDIPERKSFPPRTLIVLTVTACAVMLAALWTLAKTRWGEIDPQDPGKIFAQEVIGSMRARIPWASANGAARNGHTENAQDQKDERSKAASAGR
jgi:uncharacterized protein involved in exopolysaccharide biosynthesis